MLFVVEDNEYAISVPVEVNTPGGNISKVVRGFPNFHFAEVDGTDVLASYATMKTAIEYVRSGKGPAFVHGHVIRPYSHSLSDDEKLYRPEAERKLESERDPITLFRAFLLREDILDEAQLHEMELDLTEQVQDAADKAVAAAFPTCSTCILRISIRHRRRLRLIPFGLRCPASPRAARRRWPTSSMPA